MSMSGAGQSRAASGEERFSGARLRLARQRRGLTAAQVADACGVSRRMLSSWEGGHAQPYERHLQAAVEALAFPREFFFGPQPAEPPVELASFRALSKMTARERDRALAAAVLAFELSDWIDQRFDLPQPDLPDLRGVGPEEAAQMIRAQWGLGELPIGNIVHLIESKGVRVFSLADDTANVDAYSLWRGHAPFIFLNTRKSAERDRLDAAHELGHLVLHRDHLEPRGREREQEADAFASALLMPRSSVLAHVPRSPTLGQLIQLKRIWKVAVAALVYRLGTLDLLTEWQKRQLWIEIGRQGYRRKEPDGIPRETSQLLAKVFAALRAEGVTRRDVSRELRLRVEDLDALIFGLVAVPVEGGHRVEPPRRPDLRLVKDR
jgi:Zn-dependent peptidase ImmA (M78 family)